MSDELHYRRQVLVKLPHEFVMALLNGGFVQRDFVLVPEALGLPEGAEVMGVHTSYEAGAFVFVVAHPGFEKIPEGERLPVFPVKWIQRKLALAASASQAAAS